MTNSFQFFKKDKERFDKILAKYPNFRAYLSTSEYSIWLKTDDHYQVGDCCCKYYQRNIYLYNMQIPDSEEIAPLQMVTEKELEQATKRKKQIEYEISELKSELSTMNRLIEE